MRKVLIIFALFALPALALLGLFACRPTHITPVENQTNQGIINQSNQTSGLRQVLAEFARLDAELGTSWHDEQIPGNLIPEEAIEPWTAAMLFTRNRLEQAKASEILLNLVDARVKMIEAQGAYYLAEGFGEQGKVTIRKEGWKFYINETINCDDVQVIANATAYYDASLTAAKRAQYLLDLVLTASQEAQELIGVNEKKPAFYNSFLGDLTMRVKLTKQALAEQCAVELVIKNAQKK